MNKRRSETHDLARQLFRDQKKVLDLLKESRPGSGFEIALVRLLGDKPQRGKTVRIGNREFRYSSHEKNLVSFLPARWHEELAKTTWCGCENWWAGYPLIAWVEIQLSDDGTGGDLKLQAEVGPVSDHKIRKGIIEAIKAAASAKGLRRVQFPAGASDKGRLYSRFLQENSVVVNNIGNPDEIERKFSEIIADFGPELELVAGIIPKFPSVSTP